MSSSTYSPDGRIFQVEYAHKAVESSGYVAILVFSGNNHQYHALQIELV